MLAVVKDMMRSSQLIDLALGTLASGEAVLATTKIDGARLQGCRPKDIQYAVEWRGKTTLEGPLVYGFCEGMTIADIAEWFDSDPQHDADPGSLEQSLRHLIIVGYIGFVTTASLFSGDRVDEYGRIYRTRWPGWEIIEGEAFNFFVLNVGITLTTGLLLDGFYTVRGDWIDK